MRGEGENGALQESQTFQALNRREHSTPITKLYSVDGEITQEVTYYSIIDVPRHSIDNVPVLFLKFFTSSQKLIRFRGLCMLVYYKP